jgi:hypothetical protein
MVPQPSARQLIAMPSLIGRLTNTTFPAALLVAIWQARSKNVEKFDGPFRSPVGLSGIADSRI